MNKEKSHALSATSFYMPGFVRRYDIGKELGSSFYEA
jgi:hypothetical protein